MSLPIAHSRRRYEKWAAARKSVTNSRRRYEHGIIGVQYITVGIESLILISIVLMTFMLGDRPFDIPPYYAGSVRVALIIITTLVGCSIAVLAPHLKTDHEGHLLTARALFVVRILSAIGVVLLGIGLSDPKFHSHVGPVIAMCGGFLLLNGLTYSVLWLLDCGLQRVYGLEASD